MQKKQGVEMQNSQNQPNSWWLDASWVQPLTIVASNLLIIFTIFGFSISLHTTLREDIRAINTQTAAIHQEIRDFHGRLCAIEERNRSK